MRKYFDERGNEVKLGDVVSVTEKQIMEPFGEMTIVSSVVFKKGMEDALEAAGWITHEDDLDITVKDIIYYLAKNMNLSLSNTIKTLTPFVGIYTHVITHLAAMSIFNILYKDTEKVTKLMNKEEVFGINRFNSAAINLGKPNTMNLGIIAMFKSKEEAEAASKLSQSLIEYLNARK